MERQISVVEERKTRGPRLHGDMLSATLLAFLKGCDAYGYQLTQMMEAADLPAFDSGTVYRTLRQLEKAGFVSSFWDTSESGPARRFYSLTGAGGMFLGTWVELRQRYQEVLNGALGSFEHDGAPPSSEPSGPEGPPA